MALSEQNNCDARLQAATDKIAFLKQALHNKEQELLTADTGCLRESERLIELEDNVVAWQDKYDRLYDSHKRVQKVNQNLEDKLLKLVDRNEAERAQLTSDVATMSVRLAQANYNIATLQREIERYKSDISLAINLLQCKPDGFVPQKVSSLPIDVQSKVSSYMLIDANSHSDSEGSTSGVGIVTSSSYKVLPASDSPPPSCSFSPTAMVHSIRGSDGKKNSTPNVNLYSNSVTDCNNISPVMRALNDIKSSAPFNINNNNNRNNHIANGFGSSSDLISPSIMAKFLEEELKLSEVKHCDSCQCTSKDLTVLANVPHSYSVSTQTTLCNVKTLTLNEPLPALCIRCNSNLNSPSRTNSPCQVKILRSNDSVISDTKSSVSDVNDMDKLFTGAKRDDLMVNPILSHHRLCERKASSFMLHGRRLSYSGNYSAIQPNSTSPVDGNGTSKHVLNPLNIDSNNGNVSNTIPCRYIRSGTTALNLLEVCGKHEPPSADSERQQDDYLNEIDDVEDEVKPLLSDFSGTNSNERKKRDDIEERSVRKASNDNGCANRSKSDLMQDTISGSVNSLWSKVSSCEGVKMFENFNRNLIKTIKAENPKYHGPRLCAIRIQQNGGSNILLDNTESMGVATPIVYTKRERFLDEELDDGKIIITSSTNEGRLMDTFEKPKSETQDHNKELMKIQDEASLYIPEKLCKSIDTDVNENCILVTRIPKIYGNSEVSPNSASPTRSAQNTDNQTLQQIEGQFSNPLEAHNQKKRFRDPKNNKQLTLVKELIQPDAGCKNSQKSYTSSTISEAIDLQESEQFRRQQLSRVAEWIQNNSTQLQNTRQQTSTEVAITLHQPKSAQLEITNHQPLYSTADSALESQHVKVSTENTHKINTCSWRTSVSGLPAYNAKKTCCSLTEQPAIDILNYKYYPWDTDRSLAIEAELHTTTQHVDIAQMEYNVKQFLLKQNEWSIRNSKTNSATTNSKIGVASIPTVITQECMKYRNNVRTTRQQHQQLSRKTLRQSKLYSDPGIGPGIGERITVMTTGVTGMEISKIESQRQTVPHRTETNL